MTGDLGHRPPPGQGAPRGAGPAVPAGTAADPGAHVILEQGFDGGSLYALRSALAAHASEVGLPPHRVGDLIMAAHELAANAVRHGGGRGWLRLWTRQAMLVCQVSDHGAAPGPATRPGSDGERPAQADGSAAPTAEPGHGLWLVRQLAEETSLRTGPRGTVATACFRLGPPGAPRSFHLVRHAERGCTVLVVTGPLEDSSADLLSGVVEEVLAANPAARLVLDLAGVTSWDSAGLAAVLAAQRRADTSPPARVVLAGTPAPLAGRLRDARPGGRFTLASGTDEAIAELTRGR